MNTKKLSQLEVLESAEGTHVLVEQDGTHKRVPAAKIVGGSASIDVTATVGQTIVVTEVDANGKPTKWEAADYQEKICGSELGYIIPETTVNYTDEDTENDGQLVVDELLVLGETYVVNWNGVDYTCVCKEVVRDGMTVQAVGNALILGGEDTGEPFGGGTMVVDGTKIFVAIPVDESVTSFTFSVKGKKAIPIPVEYVTNAFPYYIEVTGSGTDDDPYVCNETVANVNAIYQSGRPLAVRYTTTMNTNPVSTAVFLLPCTAIASSSASVSYGFGDSASGEVALIAATGADTFNVSVDI